MTKTESIGPLRLRAHNAVSERLAVADEYGAQCGNVAGLMPLQSDSILPTQRSIILVGNRTRDRTNLRLTWAHSAFGIGLSLSSS